MLFAASQSGRFILISDSFPQVRGAWLWPTGTFQLQATTQKLQPYGEVRVAKFLMKIRPKINKTKMSFTERKTVSERLVITDTIFALTYCSYEY